MTFPVDFLMGVTASVVANIIGTPSVDQEGTLAGEYRKAQSRTAEKLAQQKAQHFDLPSQVETFFSPLELHFVPFLASMAEGKMPDESNLIAAVRARMAASGNLAESPDRVIPLFQAQDHEISALFREYLQILAEEIRRMPRLSCYYNLLLCERVAAHVASISGQIGTIITEQDDLGTSLKTLVSHAQALQVLRPIAISETTVFRPYPLADQEGRAQRFFEGRDPSWADIATGFGIVRQGFRQSLLARLQGIKDSTAILVNAVAGAGKSTEILRLAWELSQDSRFVVYQGRYLGTDATRLAADVAKIIAEAGERTPVIAVDGAAATLELWREVARDFRATPLVWLVCDRTERWLDALGRPLKKMVPNDLGVDELVLVPLLPLDAEEIGKLIDQLLAWKILPETDSREEWTSRFRERYQGQILVTLLEIQAEAGKRQFKEKLVREARDFAATIAPLGRNAAALRNLYPAVAALHRFGIAPAREWILRWLATAGSDERLTNEQAIQQAIDAEIFLMADNEHVQCRHEVIAEVITQEILGQPESGALLCEVYRNWILGTDPQDTAQALTIKSLFNLPVHRRKLWSIRDRLRLYEELRAHFPGDYIAESAAAFCAIKSGRADLARQWLATGSDNRGIYQHLAADSSRRGEFDAARGYYHQALGHPADARPEEILASLRKGPAPDPALLSEWAGFLKAKSHRLDLAEQVFRLLITAGLADGLVYRELIWTLHKQGADPAALDSLFEEATEACPESVPFFVMLRADLHPARRRAILEQAITDGRADAAICLEHIRAFPNSTVPEQIIPLYQRATKRFSTNAPLFQAFALFLDKHKRTEEAEVQFKAGIAADPTNAHLFQAFALFLDKHKRTEEAEVQFKAGIAADPTHAPLFQAFALFLDKHKRTEEAEVQFKAGIAADPTHAPLFQAFALFLDKHKRTEEAEVQFKAGIAADPTDAPLFQAFALFLDKHKRTEEAEVQFKAGIAADPTNAHLFHAFALFLDKHKRTEEAEVQFKAGIAADPTHAHLWADMVRFFFNLGYRRCAVACGREALKRSDLSAPLTQIIARCLWSMRYWTEAIALLKDGWDLLEKSKGSKTERARMWAAQGQTLASYLARIGERAPALQIVQAAMKKAPLDTRLKELEQHLNDSSYTNWILEPGGFTVTDQIGEIHQAIPGRPLFIYPPGASRGIFVHPGKNSLLPPSAWAPGQQLIFDIWAKPDGKTYATNVEPVEWEWRGEKNLFLQRLTLHAVQPGKLG